MQSFFSLGALGLFATVSNAAAVPTCRYLPGDAGWPSVSTWKALNSSVGGRLVATVPLGSPCHDPTYNAKECAALQSEWLDPSLQLVVPVAFPVYQTNTADSMESSSSIMAPFFANQSCDPWTAESRTCTLGNYVDYAVNVSSAQDISLAVIFASENNIRLVIRNTGHE